MKPAIGIAIGAQLASLAILMCTSAETASHLIPIPTVITIVTLGLNLRRYTHIEKAVEERVSERTNELVEMMTRYEQAAMTDALTGLLNRRGGEDALAQHVNRSRRLKTRFSVIVLDIDHFKKINDRYGHAVGDLVLSGVANAVKAQLRESDIACRWGGEEFVLGLPDTDLTGAIMVAEKLRKVIEKLDFDITPVSASFGCSELGEESVELAIARADMNLYVAKSKGRNMVFPKEI